MATLEIVSTYCAETDSDNPTQINNSSFDVGAFSSQVNESYAYFPLSSLSAYAIVTSGVLKLRQFDGDYYSKEVTMRAAGCSNYISPASVNWNNKPSAGSIYKDLTFSGDSNTDRTWTLTGNLNTLRVSNYLIIKVWVPGASAGDINAKGFRASTYGTMAYRPTLTLSYYDMPLKVASSQGSVDRQVLSIKIATSPGAINKTVVGMKIAPVQGAISKTVF